MKLFLFLLCCTLIAFSNAITVSTVNGLINAVKASSPQSPIIIAPGTYDMTTNKVACSASGTAGNPIVVKAQTLGTVKINWYDNYGYVEGFLVTGDFWTFENLEMEGKCNDHNKCDWTLRGSKLYNFNAMIKANQAGGATLWPDRGLIEGNEFFATAPRVTGNPVSFINIDGGDHWILRENLIYDFYKASGNGISFGAFFKSNGHYGIMERNVVIGHRFLASGGIRIGLSFGGGGSNGNICDSDPRGSGSCTNCVCGLEHQHGIMRNNILINFPVDVAITNKKGYNCTIINNSIYNNAQPPNDMSETSIDQNGGGSLNVINNLMSGRYNPRGQITLAESGNIAQVTNANMLAWFQDVLKADLRLSVPIGSTGVQNAGDKSWSAYIFDDFCRQSRPANVNDVGAVQYSAGACDTRTPLMLQGAVPPPTPQPATPPPTKAPTKAPPTKAPTKAPVPTTSPTKAPVPTKAPTRAPLPTTAPTDARTPPPTKMPVSSPTGSPPAPTSAPPAPTNAPPTLAPVARTPTLPPAGGRTPTTAPPAPTVAPPSNCVRTIQASTETQLVNAVQGAAAGDCIELSGTFVMNTNKVRASASGTAASPIRVYAKSLGDAKLSWGSAAGYMEGFLVTGDYWTFENLEMEGTCADHSKCEHAWHVSGAHFSMIGCKSYDFNAHLKANSNGEQWPDYGLVQRCEIFNRDGRQTSNPVNLLNVDGGDHWRYDSNLIYDFWKNGGNGISFGGFFKSNGKYGIMENNVVIGRRFTQAGGARIGLSFGGGGSNGDICDDDVRGSGDCANCGCGKEHQHGIVRSNIIAHVTDVAFSNKRGMNSSLIGNIFYKTGGASVDQNSGGELRLANNLMSGTYNARGQTTLANEKNIQMTENMFKQYFVDPDGMDFRLKAGKRKRFERFLSKRQATVPTEIAALADAQFYAYAPIDFCLRPRPTTGFDVGALDFSSGSDCDTRTPLLMQGVPSTPTNAPGTPTNAPGTPTNAPGTPTNAPGTPTNAPGTPTNAPGGPTRQPTLAPRDDQLGGGGAEDDEFPVYAWVIIGVLACFLLFCCLLLFLFLLRRPSQSSRRRSSAYRRQSGGYQMRGQSKRSSAAYGGGGARSNRGSRNVQQRTSRQHTPMPPPSTSSYGTGTSRGLPPPPPGTLGRAPPPPPPDAYGTLEYQR